ncbi:MAG: hypothetical protein ABW182_11655 [Sphingomonas sp.]
MNLQRSWWSAFASFSIAVALFVSLLPQGVAVAAYERAAFSEHDAGIQLLVPDRYIDGRRLSKDWRPESNRSDLDGGALLPIDPQVLAGVEPVGSVPATATAYRIGLHRWRPRAQPRAPPLP